jgi:hypothetical protein
MLNVPTRTNGNFVWMARTNGHFVLIAWRGDGRQITDYAAARVKLRHLLEAKWAEAREAPSEETLDAEVIAAMPDRDWDEEELEERGKFGRVVSCPRRHLGQSKARAARCMRARAAASIALAQLSSSALSKV